MTNLPPDPDTNSDTGDDIRVGPDRGSPPSAPRWVKISGMIVIGLVLLVVIILVAATALDLHEPSGPGRHRPSGVPTSSVEYSLSGGPGGHTPPSSVTEYGVQPL